MNTIKYTYEVIIRSAQTGLVNNVFKTQDLARATRKFDAVAKLGYPVALVSPDLFNWGYEKNQNLLPR